MEKLPEEVLSSKGLQSTEDIYKQIIINQGRVEHVLLRKARDMLEKKEESVFSK